MTRTLVVALLIVIASFAVTAEDAPEEVIRALYKAHRPWEHKELNLRSRAVLSKYFSPERVQLLLFTLGTAMFYLNTVTQNRASGVLPDVSKETLALLGGSHAIYLVGKAYMMLFKKTGKGD